jgi:hypothetical protein
VSVIVPATIREAWAKFTAGGIHFYQAEAIEFHNEQPHLWNILRVADREWFSDGNHRIASYGTFIWRLMRETQGPRATLSEDDIVALLEPVLEAEIALDDESEHAQAEAGRKNALQFPQPPLGFFILKEFAEETAHMPEMTPTNNRACIQWLFYLIIALTKAPAR